MKTLKQLIVEALEASKDCIQITYLSKSCEPELEIDFEAMAENVSKAYDKWLMGSWK